MTVAPLDDGWQLRGCLGDEWEWHVQPRGEWDAPGWLPARVPGSVIDDLRRAGEAPDPYHERNSLQLEWVPQRTWVYRRHFTVEPLAGGERAVLRFGGVDHAATVFVDGREAARHEGAFRPFGVDVTDDVQGGGEHLLAVVVHRAPDSEPQVGRTSRVRVHKSRMGYGWDFCPRMIHQGIWRPVELRVDEPLVRLVAGATLSRDLAEGTVAVEADVARAARVVATLLDGGRAVAREEIELPAGGRAALELGAERPRLWWPNGLGRQELYELRVDVERDGRPTSARSLVLGFRRVELAANDRATADALPYTVVANGVRTYVNGWNWVPVDALYGVPRPAKLAHLLELAARANVNLLRVWGGGLIETEDFYGLCDGLGLLVWQEFSMSSSGIDSVPSEDASFVRLMTEEARDVVPRRRHHPSLVVWCGGNELASADGPLDDPAPVLGALRDVVRELDPDRAWLPTSPSGAGHDVHGPWEHQGLDRHYELYDAGTSLLHSEFGVEGMTNRRALEAVISPRHRWPADRSNPVYAHLGAWWNNAPLVQAAFGGRLRDLGMLRRASQHLQHDGLRYAVEANRRRAFRSSGTIPWQLNESYPNAWCTSAVDYHGDPKPGYHGVRRAYEVPHVAASFARCAWGGERAFRAAVWAWAGRAPHDAVVSARVVDVRGAIAAQESWTLAGLDDVPVPAGEIEAELGALATELFVLDLRLAGGGESENRYLMSRTSDLAPVLDLEPAAVAVELERDGDTWHLRLRHTGGPAALGLVLEDARPLDSPGWAVFAENPVDLLPGESRTVAVEWRGAPDTGRSVLVEGWNVEAQHVP